ncbi:MAG: peptidylprolyl isomerase [Bacteroidales bacterium]|nr:peptidylprolyl isomerase [Bacteroidales bacterium]
MKIEKNKVVALIYELTVDGQIADKCTDENPLQFIFGAGMLLPKFEENILGKEVNDCFEFTLSPEEGYGVSNPQMVIDFPKDAFKDESGNLMEEILFVGSIIPLQSAQGQVFQGRITEILEDAVKIDLNHPMAGKTLNFKGEIVSVREATDEELAGGLQRGGCCGKKGGCKGGKRNCKKSGESEGCCGKEAEGECCDKGEGCCEEEKPKKRGCCKKNK